MQESSHAIKRHKNYVMIFWAISSFLIHIQIRISFNANRDNKFYKLSISLKHLLI